MKLLTSVIARALVDPFVIFWYWIQYSISEIPKLSAWQWFWFINLMVLPWSIWTIISWAVLP